MSDQNQAAHSGPVYLYPMHEAVLTQLGRDCADAGRLIGAEDLRFRDLFNFLDLFRAPADHLLGILGDLLRILPEQHDRLVAVWHWRDHSAATGLRDWLHSQGGLDRAGLLAARDRLAVLAGVTPSQVDQMPLQTALATPRDEAAASQRPQPPRRRLLAPHPLQARLRRP
jgi:hypothetical protein